MKLSNLTAKLTCMKSNVVRILTTATLAGAALALAPAANAQYMEHGPGPVFHAPYHDHFYWEHRRFEEERARDWRFHHEGPYGFRR